MKKLFETLTKILNAILIIILSIITLLVVIQVVTRYVFDNPTTWTEEAVRYFFVWLVMLGSVKAFQEGAHLCVDIILDHLTVKGKYIYYIIVSFVVMAYFCIVIYAGYEIMPKLIHQLSPTLRISMAIPYGGIIVGCAIMAIQELGIAIQNIKGLKAYKGEVITEEVEKC